MKKTKKERIQDCCLSIFCGVFSLFIIAEIVERKETIYMNLRDGNGNGTMNMYLAFLNINLGISFVYILLLSLSLYFLLSARVEYLLYKKNEEVSRNDNYFIIMVKWIGRLTLVYFLICVAISFNKYMKTIDNLKNNGKETVIYIYDLERDLNRYGGIDKKMYYYKYKGFFFNNNQKCFTAVSEQVSGYEFSKYLHRFYKTTYLLTNVNIRKIDFRQEIHEDSVFKYFPSDRNPFLKEINECKEYKLPRTTFGIGDINPNSIKY